VCARKACDYPQSTPLDDADKVIPPAAVRAKRSARREPDALREGKMIGSYYGYVMVAVQEYGGG